MHHKAATKKVGEYCMSTGIKISNKHLIDALTRHKGKIGQTLFHISQLSTAECSINYQSDIIELTERLRVEASTSMGAIEAATAIYAEKKQDIPKEIMALYSFGLYNTLHPGLFDRNTCQVMYTVLNTAIQYLQNE